MEEAQPKDISNNDGLEFLMWTMWVGLGLGLIAIIFVTLCSPQWALLGLAVLIVLAAFAAGAFFGFLFGVPQVLSGEGKGVSAQTTTTPPTNGATTNADNNSSDATSGARLLKSNTNLEKISNWLTTLIVGATLTQIGSLDKYLSAFRDFLSTYAAVVPVTRGAATAGLIPAVGPILVIFGVVCGFLFMYLNTRLVLILVFNTIERTLGGGDSLKGETKKAVSAVVRNADELGDFRKNNFLKKPSKTVEDALGVMLDLLYKDAPDRVIDIGANLTNSAAEYNPEYWLYMAAAFGQRMKRYNNDDPEYGNNRDNALDCAQRAVALNPAYRERLWAISDSDSSDDDLSALRNDEIFLRIVGRTHRG